MGNRSITGVYQCVAVMIVRHSHPWGPNGALANGELPCNDACAAAGCPVPPPAPAPPPPPPPPPPPHRHWNWKGGARQGERDRGFRGLT